MLQHCRVAIVVSTFHKDIVKCLLKNSLSFLYENGFESSQTTIVEVPGAFEIPVVAAKYSRSKNWDGVLCLGCVIKGETPHFDYICSELSRGLMSLSMETEKPIIHGVLTVNSYDQAIARCGMAKDMQQVNHETPEGKRVVSNKGAEDAKALVSMLKLLKGEQF